MPPSQTLTLHNAAKFRDCLNVMAALCDSVTLKYDHRTKILHAIVMDMSHVSLLQFTWKAVSCDSEEDFSISFGFKHMSQALQFAKTPDIFIGVEEDSIHLSMNDEQVNFRLKQIDIDDIEMNIDDFDHERIEIDRKEFADLVKQYALISDSFEIEIADGQALITASGDIGDVKISYTTEANTMRKQALSTKFVISFMKTVSQRFHIQLADQMPCVFAFDDDDFTLKFFLAPKIEDDMDT